MRRIRQMLPLLIGVGLALFVAMIARTFATMGVPRTVSVAVAAIPLHPGRVIQEGDLRTVTAYESPALSGMIREEEMRGLVGGMVVMFVPAGAMVPRTAIVPPRQITAPGRLSTILQEGERLMVLPVGGRISGPPVAALRPGDCLDLVAFFRESSEASGRAISPTPERAEAPAEMVPSVVPLTATVSITTPTRPLAKWIARVVVRSVLGISAPPARPEAGAVGGGGASASVSSGGSPQMLVAIPETAAEGIAYALGSAEQVHLLLAPPCARAEILPSSAFSEWDLEEWVRSGRAEAGPPAFFLPISSTLPTKPSGGAP
ncbi:RcpC/CpaB family pilus assembly protein [Thermoflexus hugenholtzii]|uniref:Flp pilus assembly protein CpaB n=1 Tax=Thermoflexus hugenholtzii JAD2 TaxID=877466 RepID=A0A212QML8_9CHLR|nr:hypothetical protein [Thermoflexus hugenholtzii]SNB60607.1 Flp pilus assembly protein CpaB [Thermoflexus hugenholtzii JAD2]